MPITLNLTLDDPDVLRYLGDDNRVARAKTALRVGVTALGAAEGVIDSDAVRHEGELLLANLKSRLDTHVTDVGSYLGAELSRYLTQYQEKAELIVQRESGVVDDFRSFANGMLGDSGTVARILAQGVGHSSPLLRLIDPEQRGSVYAQMETMLKRNLDAMNASIATEFTLDRADSALSKLVREIAERNGKITHELSLDHADSAISRLVKRVEEAQRITATQLDLQNADGGLARMHVALSGTILDARLEQRAFQASVLEVLARYDERKKVEQTGTQHGMSFEQDLLAWVENRARGTGDLFEATGTTTGLIRNCKVGDCVVTAGPDHVAAGRRVVFEAKEDASYGERRALEEIELASKNRDAEVGVFVFSSRTASDKKARFKRAGSHLLVVWDHEDRSTDVFLEAAYATATALLARAAAARDAVTYDFGAVDTELAEIEKQVARVADIREKCESIRRAATAIEETARVTSDKIGGSAERLRAQVMNLKASLEK